jgi:hypothetical protein
MVQEFNGSRVHRFGFKSSGVQRFRFRCSASEIEFWNLLNFRTPEPEPMTPARLNS